MANYTLTKEAKGSKFVYLVKNENGEVVSKRTSAREYVACTVDAKLFFGRRDLVGKGEHGKQLAQAHKYANYTEHDYTEDRKQYIREARQCIKMEQRLNHTEQWMQDYCDGWNRSIDEYYPLDEDKQKAIIERKNKIGKDAIEKLQVVYL